MLRERCVDRASGELRVEVLCDSPTVSGLKHGLLTCQFVCGVARNVDFGIEHRQYLELSFESCSARRYS